MHAEEALRQSEFTVVQLQSELKLLSDQLRESEADRTRLITHMGTVESEKKEMNKYEFDPRAVCRMTGRVCTVCVWCGVAVSNTRVFFVLP